MSCCTINNEFLIQHLTAEVPAKHAKPRHRQASTVLLGKPLPALRQIQDSAIKAAHRARRDHILTAALSTALETPLDARPPGEVKKQKTHHERTSSEPVRQGRAGSFSGPGPDGNYEAFHLLRAIEKKDLMLLMEIRSRQFELLVRALPGTQSTPLLHTIRLGPSHREVAIVLTGAISKKVNDLTDEDLSALTPSLRAILRSIRANLKIAIQYSLESSQTDLVASYLQVIIMSEGDKLVQGMTQKVALSLRAGKAGDPVRAAEDLLNKWVSRELKKGEIATVNEYLNNAAGDLILMALWNIATDKVLGESIPTYFFARDDRILKALEERLEEMKKAGDYLKLSKLLRAQIETTVGILAQRKVGYRARVELLKQELDAS